VQDEPTTGLDSAGALNVMLAVKKLCKEANMSMICTLHQPNDEIVRLFDTLLLCKSGGEIAFYGHFQEVTEYLESVNLSLPQKNRNVADIAIEAISRIKNNGGYDLKGRQVDVAQLFLQSPYAKPVLDELERGIVPPELLPTQEEIAAALQHPSKQKSTTGASIPIQIAYLMHRSFVSSVRDRPALIARNFAPIFLAFLVGTLFYQMPLDQTHAANRLSIIYLAIVFMVCTSISISIICHHLCVRLLYTYAALHCTCL
jgi:hypothetical protein